jgi:hypothetical protein
MNGEQQSEREFPVDRRLFFIVRVVLGLILFPVVTLLMAAVFTELLTAAKLSENHENSGLLFVTIASAIVGIATSVLIVWKSGGLFRKLLVSMRSKLPEPVHSCIEFGVLGGLLFGGIMVAGILLLGHTRPAGWDFNRVLPSMGLGFALFLLGGLPVGIWRKRRSGSSLQ